MTFLSQPIPEPATPLRLAWLDVARGVAVLAMFVYHFAWDLQYFALTSVDVVGEPGWRWFARAIAGSFLGIVGFSLVLAHANGLRRGPFLRRLAVIAGAAALVTAGTYVAMPQGTIWFGILHCIALSSVLGLAFLRLPALVLLAFAAAALAAPLFATADVFNHPAAYWIGLGTIEPRTNDYVPILPWFGCVLIGMAVGKIWLASERKNPSRPAALPAAAGPVAFLGRHSLPIYLVHQPVLVGLLYLFVTLSGGGAQLAETREFRQGCRAQCEATGGDIAACRRFCACAETGLKREGVWTAVTGNTADPAAQARIQGVVAMCSRQVPGQPADPPPAP